ncbi:M16 family metallopeptidase [Marnyiella aurantia]|uniref:M16 family metallopeptidase n=1 Tax=Marnyiella aurantia TaxID=2758037 RepID=UPI001E6237BC|nr:M16 family metallopeptidase [Marnyiella aurantia]
MLNLKYKEISHTDANGYSYITVESDDNNVRIYTLKNGLQVYLAQNFDAPRIQTYIPVRTGSNNDPADNTGLAHYLEHMMFKGTSKIGTLDWDKESALLNEIAELYEQHKAENDPDRKRKIYKKIDEVSQRASKFALANEYDKCISALGASGTNAHTWLNETVYKNNIPKNELERWLKIEKERFGEIVLRLFHTELESVYEEFNRAQDHDGRLVNDALMAVLFPTHQNGQQTTLGKAEHLKNPSMKAIHRYFDEYYVPNNYAMVLVGDLEFDETIQLVDEYFGQFNYSELPIKTSVLEQPMSEIVSRTVKSPTVPRLQLAWRTDSYGTDEALMADLAAHILSNSGEAGLLDLHINNAQEALYATAYATAHNEYGYISMVVVPKEDQTFEQAEKLVHAEIERIKKGDFPDWLLPAIINDFKVQRLKGLETADGLAANLYQTYIRKQTWQEELEEMDRYEAVTKENIVEFANRFFKDNYAVVYKEKGTNEDLLRVDNPGITPVTINRDAESDFLKSILAEKTSEIEPEFIDYKKEIEVKVQNGVKFSFVPNRYNSLAQVHYIFPFGSDHDRELSLATQVLQYLGTNNISPDELKQEFYKIGITHEFKTAPDQLTISLTGLEENIAKGIGLLHHWIQEALPDQAVYDEYVETILESRNAAKRDKGRIMRALQNYAKFGADSRSRDVVPEQRLREITCGELTDKLKGLFSYAYEVFLYGGNMEVLTETCLPFVKQITGAVPERKMYPQPETGGKVYFVDYDMVQTELSLLGRAGNVDPSTFGRINVFNEYFGSGLSSIIFQELRESRSLAYSAYAVYQSSPELLYPDYITTYIGTQPDKLEIAVKAMQELMEKLPTYEAQFESAKQATLKQLASGRVTRTNIFFNHLRLLKLGIDYDLRKGMYAEVEKLTLEGLEQFYEEKIQPVKYNVAVIGKRENLRQDVLERLGTVTEVSLEEVFGY